MRRTTQKILAPMLAALVLITSGCGWRLRGNDRGLSAIDSVVISAGDVRSDLVISLQRALQSHGVTATTLTGAGDYRITILNQRTERRTASISGAGRAAEYLLLTTVIFLVEAPSDRTNRVTAPVTISARRYYDFNEDRVLASEYEQRELQEAITANLVQQIISHLQSASRRDSSQPDATET